MKLLPLLTSFCSFFSGRCREQMSSYALNGGSCEEMKKPLPPTGHVQIVSDQQRWDINLFQTPLHYKDQLDYILIPNGVIKNRVEKLVEEITNDYAGEEIHLLCVLNGTIN